MTPRNLFRVFVAGIGFIGAGYGLLYVLDALLYSLGLSPTQSSSLYTKYYALRGLLEILIGYWVMRSAGTLANIAFPVREEELEGEEWEDEVEREEKIGGDAAP